MAPDFSSRTQSLYDNPYTFTGRELDTLDAGSLSLMYYRARSYDPETGRFMQRDPLGINPAGGEFNAFDVLKQYSDGMNLYEYVRSNTQIHLDPDGKCIRNIVGGVAKFFGCGISIYCRNNEIMPWPIKYFDHCHPFIGPFDINEGADMTKPDAKVYPVVVIRSGVLKYGAIGKPCKCATCGDIRNCVAEGRNIGYHGIWPYIRGRNCQGATAKAIMGCCLRSTWRPSVAIDELEPNYDPYDPSFPLPDPTGGMGPCFP
jgi:RHS repeat-associated protein